MWWCKQLRNMRNFRARKIMKRVLRATIRYYFAKHKNSQPQHLMWNCWYDIPMPFIPSTVAQSKTWYKKGCWNEVLSSLDSLLSQASFHHSLYEGGDLPVIGVSIRQFGLRLVCFCQLKWNKYKHKPNQTEQSWNTSVQFDWFICFRLHWLHPYYINILIDLVH